MSDRDYGDETQYTASGPFGRLPDQDDPYEAMIAKNAELVRLDKLMEEDARLLNLPDPDEVPVEMVEMIFTEETAQTIPFITTGSGRRPEKQHREEDAAYDLCSNHAAMILPGMQAIVNTGLRLAIPEGMVGLVCTRSGMASKAGVFVLNAPGIIDPGYRGEIGLLLYNTSRGAYYIAEGERIAQLLLLRTPLVQFEARDSLKMDTMRSDGGFGSTGR